jgi:predicted RNA binding protein YcfA (HicA-like mRNA interferase family)
MPKLRRLSGDEVIKILQGFGFSVFSQRGSHVRLQRITQEGQQQRLVVPVHGRSPIPLGTLRSIYRQASAFISEDDLRALFYTE